MTTPTTPAADAVSRETIIEALDQYTRGDEHQRAIEAAIDALRTATARESALVAERDALRAALPQWLPIETAPKDGTAIFAKLPDSDIPHSVRFSNERWRIVWDHSPLGWLDAPTHWMPIPALAAPAVEG